MSPTLNKYPGYDIEQADGEAPVMGNMEYPFIAVALKSTLALSGSMW